MPANQRFCLVYLPRFQFDNRLVQHFELMFKNSNSHIVRQPDPVLRSRLHESRKIAHPVAACLFGRVERLIRIFQQRLNPGTVIRINRYADTGGKIGDFPIEAIGLGQRMKDILRYLFRDRQIGQLRQNHREFISSQPRNRIDFPDTRRATSIKSLSPMSCPRVSLTSLKLSRSRNRSASFLPD